MYNKYKWTLFDHDVTVNIPIKNKENKEYFFRINYKNIWYISLQTFSFLLIYYLVLGLFWLRLYQQHFIVVSLLVITNIVLTLIVLIRNPLSWKNMFDMLLILKRYSNKKQLAIRKKGNVENLFTKLQTDKL